MSEPITSGYPGHVRILSHLAQVENFARDPDLIAGRINLALHQTSMSEELKGAISIFTAKAIFALRNGSYSKSRLMIYHLFRVEELDKKSDADLAREWLQSVEQATIKADKEHLMPLALDVVARAKNFLLTWTDRVKEAELPDDGHAGAKLMRTLRRSFSRIEYVTANLSVQENEEFAENPKFYNPYPDKGVTPLYGEVNYQGEGMMWFDNDNVLRLPRHDRGSPQNAQILNGGCYYRLNPGQAAFFTGDRQHGLAIAPSMPFHPADPPCVSMSLTRRVSHPG